MEKNFMKRRLINNIPIWEWKGVELIRVGKATYVTVKPVFDNVRSLSDARSFARNFEQVYKCQATIIYDTEWMELLSFLKATFSSKDFIELNSLDKCEALLLDSLTGGEKYSLAGGCNHRLDELFNGFISGQDSDGEPQPEKLLFLTIRLNLN